MGWSQGSSFMFKYDIGCKVKKFDNLKYGIFLIDIPFNYCDNDLKKYE